MKAKVLKARNNHLSKEQLAVVVETLKAGRLVIFPTDTVYGIGCSAFHPGAIARVYEMKGRAYTKPLPVLLPDAEQLELVASEVLPQARLLLEAFWPGPLTLVFKTSALALHASRGKATIAVRVPDHGIARQVLIAAGIPMVVTSANRSGKRAINSGIDAVEEFESDADIVIDGGACPVGQESSVVDVTHFPFSLLREGALSKAVLYRKIDRS